MSNPLPSLGPCDEKIKLLFDYQRLVLAHSTAVSLLGGAAGEDFKRMKAAAELAHDASVAARRRFDEHISRHGC